MSCAIDGNQDKLFELIQKANKQQTLELKDEFRDIIKETNDKLDATNKEVVLLKLRCVKIERSFRRNNIVVFLTILRQMIELPERLYIHI